jgi:riboflavin synthase
MFTGLIQQLGTVARVDDDGHGGRRLQIAEATLAPLLTLGESVAVNGVCLTVVAHEAHHFDFQAGPETLAKTTLGSLAPGHAVNLERALRVGDAIGGHFVTGHVDCVASIASRQRQGEWEFFRFQFDTTFDDLLVHKGSIAVDGVSLTLVDVEPGTFSVMLIPHTLTHTTLGQKTSGDKVNLEFDLLAKHVRKLFQNLTITL